MENSSAGYQFHPSTTELNTLYVQERKVIVQELRNDLNRAGLRKALDQLEGLHRYLTLINMNAEPKLKTLISSFHSQLKNWYLIFKDWFINLDNVHISILAGKLESYLATPGASLKGLESADMGTTAPQAISLEETEFDQSLQPNLTTCQTDFAATPTPQFETKKAEAPIKEAQDSSDIRKTYPNPERILTGNTPLSSMCKFTLSSTYS